MAQTEERYSYSAQPHAAPGPKKKTKYRPEDEEETSTSQNIMYDSRVVRGNTYAAKTITVSSKRASPGKKAHRASKFSSGTADRPGTPPPVDGRCHMDIQTDEFLEVIADRPPETDAETQTLPYMDRPASPLFIRAKTGVDIQTQIEEDDLFDFDLEVEPILEVLVGKTLHLSMLEIMQEEELEAIRLQQEEFENVRNVEFAEVQRLEAEIKRKEHEKERRIKQEIKRLHDRRNLEESIAARAFSNQFLGDLHVSVFDALEEQGAFYDPLQREVEELFLVDLMNGLQSNSNSYEAACQMAVEIIEQAKIKAKKIEKEAITHRRAMQARQEEERIEREAREKEERERLAAEAAAAAAAEEAG